MAEAETVNVPREPTMEMGLAGAEQVNRHMRGPGPGADYDAAKDAYRAMLSAAPKAAVAEAETKEAHTPGPWTTEPGRFWVCNVGNNLDDPGVWSAFPVPDGQPFPFGDKAADARLIAAAPDLLAALKSARESIIQLTAARGSECEGSPEEWTAEIDAAIQRAEA